MRDIRANIIPLLYSLESEYIADGYSDVFAAAFAALRSAYESASSQARLIATRWAQGVSLTHLNKFIASAKRAVGVDLNRVVQDEGLEDLLRASVANNVSLIRSIPSQYFQSIENAVYSGTIQGSSAKSLEQQIFDIGGVTMRRASFIARDQTAKLNAALNQHRQMRLGVEKYQWWTSEDERVRKTHNNNGNRIFRWDAPPSSTGHPGHDPGCRCVARAIFDI